MLILTLSTSFWTKCLLYLNGVWGKSRRIFDSATAAGSSVIWPQCLVAVVRLYHKMYSYVGKPMLLLLSVAMAYILTMFHLMTGKGNTFQQTGDHDRNMKYWTLFVVMSLKSLVQVKSHITGVCNLNATGVQVTDWSSYLSSQLLLKKKEKKTHTHKKPKNKTKNSKIIGRSLSSSLSNFYLHIQ